MISMNKDVIQISGELWEMKGFCSLKGQRCFSLKQMQEIWICI